MRSLFLLAFLLGGSAAPAQNYNDLPPGVESHSYTGWDHCLFLNASELPVQAVVVPTAGGRIVHYSLNGTNILLENSVSMGRILGPRIEDLFLGGYQCDVISAQPSLPEHWPLLEGPQRWTSDADFAVKVFSAPDTNLGIALDKEFVLAGDTGELGVVQRLRNVSAKEVTYALADRTLCKGGGFVFLPVKKKSRFKAGWAQVHDRGGQRTYDGDHPDPSIASVQGGILVAPTGGDVTRLGADSDGSWIAYTWNHLLLVKYYLYSPKGNYGPSGVSVEIYFDRRTTELDPISPETKVAPGQSFIFPEKWLLLPLDQEVTTPAEVRKLVWKIPPSPFGR